ncbi:unnamed protein product [Moneuplotes crassus]|uniref:Uncharacterized protein n=2 Tax=Euplotes crassus TaxID=5936 RepID=A0AAD1XGK3_EUPCR|nr:unnamed protein product [Moneuplotes crassus]
MEASKPLKGITVLEFEGYPPLTFCGLMLAELGATVIHVGKKKPVPVLDTLSKGKSIIINLKKLEGENSRQIILDLLPKIDVIIEGYRPGTMEKLGLGPEDVKQATAQKNSVDFVQLKRNKKFPDQSLGHIKKDILYCRLSGFGQEGENHLIAGHDLSYLAKAGILKYIRRYGYNTKDNPSKDKPVIPFNLVADFLAGSTLMFSQILKKLAEMKVGGITDPGIIDTGLTQNSAYLFKDILSKDEKLDEHDLCQHPLNTVYCSSDKHYFAICFNKLDASSPDVQEEIIDLLSQFGYERSFLSLESMEKFFLSKKISNIFTIFKGYPVVPVIIPTDVLKQDDKILESYALRETIMDLISERYSSISKDGKDLEPLPSYYTSRKGFQKQRSIIRGADYDYIKAKFLAKI